MYNLDNIDYLSRSNLKGMLMETKLESNLKTEKLIWKYPFHFLYIITLK
jgi:hypothetical protein